MVCGTKCVLDGCRWWWQWSEEEEDGGDDGDNAGDDNYIDNDESESIAEINTCSSRQNWPWDMPAIYRQRSYDC